MARRRFLVALVPPPRLLHQLRGVRALVGAPERERIVPHVTLVPPFNVPDGGAAAVRAELRAAASATAPFGLVLGPGASFAPANPTLHLAVDGDVAALVELRARVRAVAPHRPDRHEFVGHLTLRRTAPEVATAAAAEVLSGHLDWPVDRVQLLEQVHDGGETTWRPVAEEPFGGPVVVGRGGIELHLRTVRVVEPLAGEEAERDDPDAADAAEAGAEAARTGAEPAGGERLVVVAERAGEPGRVVGRAIGVTGPGAARLDALEVVAGERGTGVARHLVARWCSDAARTGATIACSETPDPAVLRSLGFAGEGDLVTRRLASG